MKGSILVAAVDADAHRELGGEFGVQVGGLGFEHTRVNGNNTGVCARKACKMHVNLTSVCVWMNMEHLKQKRRPDGSMTLRWVFAH